MKQIFRLHIIWENRIQGPIIAVNEARLSIIWEKIIQGPVSLQQMKQKFCTDII